MQKESGGHELADLFRLALKRLEACSTRRTGHPRRLLRPGQRAVVEPTDPRCLWRNRSFRTTRQTGAGGLGILVQADGRRRPLGDGTLDGDLQVEDTGYFDWSRSGHLSTLYARTRHSTTWFPRGSVQRVTARATQRPAADGDLPSATRRQRGGGRIASVTLYYKPEATAWPRPHVLAGGVYSAPIPGQADATEVLFYLQVVTNDEDQQTIYEPYGSAESDPPTLSGIPDDDERPARARQGGAGIVLSPLRVEHTAPYAHGLPELIWRTTTTRSRPASAVHGPLGDEALDQHQAGADQRGPIRPGPARR